uniref:Uncharacterized protein n=1 Tax=Utricularia reniformis TaxID=192314 RepID=A0A1Y0B224_9LAMI|nr:hypothetical protein AEK19_MT1197 [Utricularia reniformis]ART31409.1 hypothetical protein AEK19_MT1197 [Utricularia reniformis]
MLCSFHSIGRKQMPSICPASRCLFVLPAQLLSFSRRH